MASLYLHKGASPHQVLKCLHFSRRSKRPGLFEPQQSQVPKPGLPRPRSHAECTSPQALQTLGWSQTQVQSEPCWVHRAVLPPVSIPAQAGAVPVSLALWLHWVALVPGREQPGELVKTVPVTLPFSSRYDGRGALCAHGAPAGCAVLSTPGGAVQR